MNAQMQAFVNGLVGKVLGSERAQAGVVTLMSTALAPQVPALFAALDSAPLDREAVLEVFRGAALLLSGGTYTASAEVGGYSVTQVTAMARALAEVCIGTLASYTIPMLTTTQASMLLGQVAFRILELQAPA